MAQDSTDKTSYFPSKLNNNMKLEDNVGFVSGQVPGGGRGQNLAEEETTLQ